MLCLLVGCGTGSVKLLVPAELDVNCMTKDKV
jgi:hypothetical protein